MKTGSHQRKTTSEEPITLFGIISLASNVETRKIIIYIVILWADNMQDKLAEVEISKDGEMYIARIVLPTGEVVSLENEDFEEVLEQVANDLQERYPT